MNARRKIAMCVLLMSGLAYTAGARLVAHWKFDEGAGRVAVDASGHGNNGDLVGGPQWVEGSVGGALQLEGSSWVECHDVLRPQIEDAVTVSAWVWLAAANADQKVAGNQDNINGGYKLSIYANNIVEFEIRTPANQAVLNRDVDGGTALEAGRWYHVAGVYSHQEGFIRTYVNGALDRELATREALGTPEDGFRIGYDSLDGGMFNLRGKLDDVRVYNHALGAAEIAHLAGSLRCLPPSGVVNQTVREVEAILKEQGLRKALASVEIEMVKFRRWTDADESGLFQKQLSSDLYYRLGEAGGSAGLPKRDIASLYERALASAGLEPAREGTVLLWAHKNMSRDEQYAMVDSLIQTDRTYLQGVAITAERMIRENQPKEAAEFVEQNLALYVDWCDRHPLRETATEEALPGTYFQLAKAREACRASAADIAEAYVGTFRPSELNYVPERVTALVWLTDQGPADFPVRAIRSFTQQRNARKCFREIVAQVCESFETRKDWPAFERFLDVLFTESRYPGEWTLLVESCLSSRDKGWGEAYETYVEAHPRVKFYMDGARAERYAADGKFAEAAGLYRHLLSRCGFEDDRGAFHSELCRCLFHSGSYAEAVTEIDRFVAGCRATHPRLVKDAMVLKGRAHVQLAELDRALNTFLTVTVEYPEAKETAETAFMLGYCYMLLGQFDDARAALRIVVRDYPESSHANKAQLALTRIENMGN